MSGSAETTLARLLARNLVIQHIRNALPEIIKLSVFPNFTCTEFQTYLAKSSVFSYLTVLIIALFYYDS